MILAITGGIGSGKSTVARIFQEQFSIPVFYTDIEAKKCMQQDPVLQQQIKALLTDKAYDKNGQLDRAYIAGIVFSNADMLARLNALVHPAVGRSFKKWYAQQHSVYVIKESAIILEIDPDKKTYDYALVVTAPLSLKVERVMQRDNVSKQEVQRRMANQWPDQKRLAVADFIIHNIDIKTTKEQVGILHQKLLQLS